VLLVEYRAFPCVCVLDAGKQACGRPEERLESRLSLAFLNADYDLRLN
jgi:hypothetical protein